MQFDLYSEDECVFAQKPQNAFCRLQINERDQRFLKLLLFFLSFRVMLNDQ